MDNNYNNSISDNLYLEGRNSVLEAINSGKTIEKIIIQKGNYDSTLKKIIIKAKDKGIIIQDVAKQKLDELSTTKSHQGIMALVSAYKYAEIEYILSVSSSKSKDPFIIILDGITDPHNLGAIIRTANSAGIDGIIIPKHRAVGLNSVVGKVSSGAIEYVPVAKVTNISKTIDELKKRGIWVACADMEGEICYNSNLKGPIAIVMGSEGKGVSRLVKEQCDFSIKVPMFGQISSLNVSVATGIIAYEVVRQRNFSSNI